MHYFEDPQRKNWPTVARLIAALEPVDMVLCLYPGQSADEFGEPFPASKTHDWHERVTSYEEGGEPPACSGRVPVTEELLAYLEAHADDIEDWGESLALYRPADSNVVAAFIPHEGMILVADRLASALAADGMFMSPEPPDWW